jgi:peptide/nickel transport system ATP-binding protein
MPEDAPRTDESDRTAAETAIEVAGLNVIFGRGRDAVHAVRDVSFRVRKGETYGLVGESGSGKSTVLKALTGLAPISSGEARLLGRHPPRSGHPDPAFCRSVQMVFQDPYASLHPRRTIDATLSEPLIIHRMGDRQERARRVLQALADVGLGPEFRFRYPHQLSGGQRQRVAIARALMLEPAIVLLDEPTSALDVSIQAEVLNLLRRLKQERGLTYVLVSHNLAVIAHMCERLAVMCHGRIIEELTVEQLRAGEVREAYTRQLLEAARGYDREKVRRFIDFQ